MGDSPSRRSSPFLVSRVIFLPRRRTWLVMNGAQLVEGQSGLPVDNPTASYWHKKPSAKLLGHRTTADLPSTADVVIVGSGITGACAAHTLKERQPELDVVMLEAREACWGATGRVSPAGPFLAHVPATSSRLALPSPRGPIEGHK